MKEDDDFEEVEFGYSLRMSTDDKTADIQIRSEQIISRTYLAECLRALANDIEENSSKESLCDA